MKERKRKVEPIMPDDSTPLRHPLSQDDLTAGSYSDYMKKLRAKRNEENSSINTPAPGSDTHRTNGN